MLDLKAIGEYICFLREKHNLTQYELADKLYVTHQAVSKWETGKSIPNIEVMVSLTKLFAITIDELLLCSDSLDHDFSYLLNHYPRNYIVYQLIRQKLNVNLEDVMYLLNNDERSLVINHLINNDLDVDILSLLPYLNKRERRIIVTSIRDKQILVDLTSIYHQLSQTERNLLEEKYENNKNVTFFR
jgi:transcriptional regulator with XRE-family HTH domain